MTFKQDVIMLVFKIAKYRLQQDLFLYGNVVHSSIIVAVFCYFVS